MTAALDGKVLRVTVRSWPSLQEQAAFRRRIRSSSAFSNDLVVIGDLRSLVLEGQPTWEELRRAMQIPATPDGPRRYALLITPALTDLARMIETLAPDHLEIRVFTDETTALEWLLASTVNASGP
jgi:hypothetical protein